MGTKPDFDIRRVSPEKRADPTGDLHRLVDRQPLKRLQIEAAVEKLALSAFVPVNTLPLAKHLLHRNAYFLAPQPRKNLCH